MRKILIGSHPKTSSNHYTHRYRGHSSSNNKTLGATARPITTMSRATFSSSKQRVARFIYAELVTVMRAHTKKSVPCKNEERGPKLSMRA
ncbi:hypothetical protein CDAR_486151 [Caerostris darwini]|uniref:Uncharacterized protein n=1 Tax=Caerostris darwini TaxID=1538125 RepID=A0AAV4MCK2_9ARAC|nr:hypothetical protein CDAR_486151 [Caerostris darwini]